MTILFKAQHVLLYLLLGGSEGMRGSGLWMLRCCFQRFQWWWDEILHDTVLEYFYFALLWSRNRFQEPLDIICGAVGIVLGSVRRVASFTFDISHPT
jgi:hypothetical protein